MKEKTKKVRSAAFPVVLLALAVIAPVVFNAARSNWVFMNITVGIEKFSYILFYLMLADSGLLAVLSLIRLKEVKVRNEEIYKKKAYSVVLIVLCVLTSLLFITSVAYASGNLATSEAREVYLLFLKESVGTAFVLIALFALAVFFPFITKGRRSVIAAALVVALAALLPQLFDITPYKITSHPVVLDTGEEYSVVFSANKEGTGYVEYTYKGESYKVYDQNGGRLNTESLIHSISIPYEHLDNNTYKVGSVRVKEQFSYGSRTGKEVVSSEYTFTPVTGSDMELLVISDWHTQLEKAKTAVSYTGNYDGIILLGDALPGVDFEEQVVNNIVQFAGDLSQGAKPVVYVRGNHETRGEYAGKLLDALGLDEFYYNVNVGDVSLVVLDSGEDKDDSHIEYGGMTDYNTYRADMIEWLEGTKTENEKVIALSHSYRISDVEKDLSLRGWDELERLGVRLMLSGHQHIYGIKDVSENEVLQLHPDITCYLDGGISGGDYIASKLMVSDKNILIEACNTAGEKVFSQTLEW